MFSRDLSFLGVTRPLEVEAVEGGRSMNEFSLDTGNSTDFEEAPIFGRSIDDVEETDDRLRMLAPYVAYAEKAFRQRGIHYPFRISSSRASLEVISGLEHVARLVAELSSIISIGGSIADEFEKKALTALGVLLHGRAVSVGAPRKSRRGPGHDVGVFRAGLFEWETGSYRRKRYPCSGDMGADGFVFLGRSIAGPIVYYQAKNSLFNLERIPREFHRPGQVMHDWFGKEMISERIVIKAFGVNSILTLEEKLNITKDQGESKILILDAVDIVSAQLLLQGGQIEDTLFI